MDPDFLDLRDREELQDHVVSKVPKVPLAHLETQVRQENEDRLDLLDHLDSPERQDSEVKLVFKDLLVPVVNLDHKVREEKQDREESQVNINHLPHFKKTMLL